MLSTYRDRSAYFKHRELADGTGLASDYTLGSGSMLVTAAQLTYMAASARQA
jgi:hypothetical protein